MYSQYAGIVPLDINPGGGIAVDEIVGRDAQISRLLQAVRPGYKGAVLLGDRRIGKTTLFTAIEQPLREVGHYVIRVSAETSSMDTFGHELGIAVRASRPKWNLELTGEGTLNLAIAKLTGGIKANRTPTEADPDLFSLLTRGSGDKDPHLVVFLIDEITVLATSLARNDREVALEFLRTLRRARQSSDRIVMFFAGSIGLHHAALDDSEVSDMDAVHVDVLDPESAAMLAKRLLASIDLQVTSLPEVVSEMVYLTSGFPYYVQGLAQQLQLQRNRLEPISAADVRVVFEAAMDNWNIGHYDARITQYYGDEDAELVRAILDHCACSTHPVSADDLLMLAQVVAFGPSRTKLLGLLTRLEKDHYLRRVGDRNEMANDLIRRIWKRLRRLS